MCAARRFDYTGRITLGALGLLGVQGLLWVQEAEKILVLGMRVVLVGGSWVGEVKWQR